MDKNRKEITKNISYILQFIGSARFMASLLSNLVNNLSEGIHRIKIENMMIKNVKLVELETGSANIFLNIQTLRMI